MSLQSTADEASEAPTKHQPAMVAGQRECPLEEFSWKPTQQMPEGRLPKHMQFAASLMKAARIKQCDDFAIFEGEDVLREVFPSHRIHARHELETLVAKRLGKHGSGGTYVIDRKKILHEIQPYVIRI